MTHVSGAWCAWLSCLLCSAPAVGTAQSVPEGARHDPMARVHAYAAAGLPGVMLGMAWPLNGRFTLRADYATLGSHTKDRTEEGIDYRARIKTGRLGLFGDWFVAGGLRLTGGLTFNQYRVDLRFQGNGGPVEIGGTTVVATAEDRFDVKIELPDTTPYLGIGWGHRAESAESGFGFVADLGVSIGRAKVSATASPSLYAKGVTQADIDRELEEVKDGAGKIRVLPQASLGVSYRF